MGSTFNTQILVDKLSRINASQQSIETLSHWCIFHMHKAKQVVETWERQFHSSPREQRLAFLYLANDILQNSRRKGSEFVGEFWKVLPDALRDVIESGDGLARNAATRMVNIWEERKVFGSRGQILKEEFARGKPDKDLKHTTSNQRHVGNALDRIVSGYQIVSGGQANEDSVINKCRSAISSIEKVEQETGGDFASGTLNGSVVVDELKGQNSILRNCIEELTTIESSRANLVTFLREALQEQENKLDQVRNELQAAHAHSEQVDKICGRFLNGNQQDRKENNFETGNKEQSAPVMYSKQVSFAEKSGQVEESAAAAVAAKLSASSSSAQMLSYVLSSLASGGVIGNPTLASGGAIGNPIQKEAAGDYPPEKRLKLEHDQSLYIPSHTFSQTESFQQNMSQGGTLNDQPPPPPPPSSPPPMPPPLPPVAQYMPSAGPYAYGGIQPQYQTYTSDGSFFIPNPSLPIRRE